MQETIKNKSCYAIEAQRDRDEIWDYIVADLCNPKAVHRMIDRILNDIDGPVDLMWATAPASFN